MTGLVLATVIPEALRVEIDQFFVHAGLAQDCLNRGDLDCEELPEALRDEDTMRCLRPFTLFDGSQHTGPTPMYPLLVRGVLEGVTQTGHLFVSNAVRIGIGICRNCSEAESCYR